MSLYGPNIKKILGKVTTSGPTYLWGIEGQDIQVPEDSELFKEVPDDIAKCHNCGTSYPLKPGLMYCECCGKCVGIYVPSLAWAKEQEGWYVVIMEDTGQFCFVTCPAKKVLCTEESLFTLARQIEEIFEGFGCGCSLCSYDKESYCVYSPWIDMAPYRIGEIAPAAVGHSGEITEDVWIHHSLEARGLFTPIKEVLLGRRENLTEYLIEYATNVVNKDMQFVRKCQDSVVLKEFLDTFDLVPTTFYRGKLYFDKQDFVNAAKDFKEVLKLSNTKPFAPVYRMLAAAYYKLGNTPEAVKNYEKAVTLDARYGKDEDIKKICPDAPLTYAHSYSSHALHAIRKVQDLFTKRKPSR